MLEQVVVKTHLDRYKAPPLTSIVFALLDHGLKDYSTVLFFNCISISLMVEVMSSRKSVLSYRMPKILWHTLSGK